MDVKPDQAISAARVRAGLGLEAGGGGPGSRLPVPVWRGLPTRVRPEENAAQSSVLLAQHRVPLLVGRKAQHGPARNHLPPRGRARSISDRKNTGQILVKALAHGPEPSRTGHRTGRATGASQLHTTDVWGA